MRENRITISASENFISIDENTTGASLVTVDSKDKEEPEGSNADRFSPSFSSLCSFKSSVDSLSNKNLFNHEFL